MITYPNQKVLHINKGNYTENYLTIGINEWIEASKNLKPITFRLYLYLCSNANGFDLALSRQDVMNKLGITKNSYHNGVEELEQNGYLVPKQGNIYDFYTTPQTVEEETMYQSSGTLNEENEVMYQSTGTYCTNTVVQYVPIQWDSMYQSDGTEINKINNKNKINKEVADAPILAALDSANAVENKWIPESEDSHKIFGADIHTDVKVIDIINEEYSKGKLPEEMIKEPWCTYCHVNQAKVIEYVETVLMK